MALDSVVTPQVSDQNRDRSSKTDAGEIGLREVLALSWRSRWLVFAITATCTLMAAVAAWLVPKKYDATILLSPVSSQTTSSGLGALGSTVSQLSGLASLVGVNLAGSSGTKAEAVATLQSETLTERYIRDNNLLPTLFSGAWDPARRKWNTDDPNKIPTPWKGNRKFQGSIRKVTDNPKTGLVTMTITWTDPRLAAQWANDLVRLTNEYLRDKAIEESERNIAYLTGQATKTGIVELRSAIYTLMEAEIKKEMVARGSKEYALKVIDPATVPEKESFPKPMLWTAGGFSIGLMLGLLAAAIRATLRSTDPAHSLPRQREVDS